MKLFANKPVANFVQSTFGAVTNSVTSILNTPAGQQAASAAVNKWIGPTSSPSTISPSTTTYEGSVSKATDPMSTDYTKTDNINIGVKSTPKTVKDNPKLWYWIGGGVIVVFLLWLLFRKKKPIKKRY